MIEYENPWFRVLRDGNFFFVDEPGARSGAAVLPVVGDTLWLLEMRRPAQKGAVTWEIPRGYGEVAETSLECAQRELEEETGLVADLSQLTWLGKVRPNTAILGSCIDIYLARLPADTVSAARDHEAESIVKIHMEMIPLLLAQGKLEDSFTLAALTFYWAALK
ncbi:NUDIX hydrolase [Halomonas sp. MC140]|nr:NUDIX hydrolase [Halomonas sp. MC140]MDN7131962.1 NUDIX hydrolase [Halomonas sp. MC140]